MRAIYAALLSLAAFFAIPSDAQTSTDLPPQFDGRRIQNIPPEEMWKRVAECVFPYYPALALASETTGTVAIGLCVSPKGAVSNYRVLAGHPSLVNAAVSAIQQWKFQPNPTPGAVTCSRVRALVSFNPDGSTAVALAQAILADDYGDPGLTNFQQGRPMNDPTVVPRPRSAPECQTSPAP
jgi:TonB family protein